MKKSFLLLLSITVLFQAYSQTAQWRGDSRDGKYEESGLLKKWSEDGPKLLWHYDALGPGHASATVTDDVVYTAGTNEENEMGFIVALDYKGKELWKKEYGKEWLEDWDGVRSTPAVCDDKIYMMSSYGKVVCMDATNNGEIIWEVDLFTKYGGVQIKWGVTENFGYPRKVGLLIITKLQGTLKVPCNCPTLRG